MDDKINNENIRKYIVDNYIDQIPDIEYHIYQRRDKRIDFSFLGMDSNINPIYTRYQNLVFTIIDIRNNSDPVSPESNTIIKSDNNYANETKRMVKVLLAKGWSYDEVAFEMERIYGQGIISRNGLFELNPIKEYLICATYLTISGYLFYRVSKPIIRFLYRRVKPFL
jgi:hypothetical protein